MYATNIQPKSEVTGSLPLINPEPEGQGVYIMSGKLPMTKEEGHMFVVYTVIAMVHMIYIMMLEYDSLQMLNAMLVAINTIRVHTYIQNVNIL